MADAGITGLIDSAWASCGSMAGGLGIGCGGALRICRANAGGRLIVAVVISSASVASDSLGGSAKLA